MLIANLAPAPHDKGAAPAERVAAVVSALGSLRTIIALDNSAGLTLPVRTESLKTLADGPALPMAQWPKLAFNQPLFIMFSSRTTGRPKHIVQRAGGVLLRQVKEHCLHCGLTAGDTLLFQTSCVLMMWNWQLSALASGVQIVLYDRPVTDGAMLWRIVADNRVTHFGTSATFLRLCQQTCMTPPAAHELAALSTIFSTGTILDDEQVAWVQAAVKDVPAHSISGGTDIMSSFVLGSPVLPAQGAQSPCRNLAMDVRALGARSDEARELVCLTPFPSRPLGFLADPDGERFHAAYFATNPGMWTHGDLALFAPDGGARMHGRSDWLMNIRGIRISPAESYCILLRLLGIAQAIALEYG